MMAHREAVLQPVGLFPGAACYELVRYERPDDDDAKLFKRSRQESSP
jgi:hypothetical protein